MMKTNVNSEDMETESVLTIVGAFISGSAVAIAAVIRQAKTNTSVDERLKNVEDEREDIHEIKNKITEIQINNAKYFEIMNANQKHLESVAESVRRIHQRIDLLPLANKE